MCEGSLPVHLAVKQDGKSYKLLFPGLAFFALNGVTALS